MYCICIAFIAMYLLFLPPYCPVDPATTAADVAVFDCVVDDRTPTIELPSKQCPIPSPSYHQSIYIYLLY